MVRMSPKLITATTVDATCSNNAALNSKKPSICDIFGCNWPTYCTVAGYTEFQETALYVFIHPSTIAAVR